MENYAGYSHNPPLHAVPGDAAGGYDLPARFASSVGISLPANHLPPSAGYASENNNISPSWPLVFPSPDTGHSTNLAAHDSGFQPPAAGADFQTNSYFSSDHFDNLPSSSVQYSFAESHGVLDEPWYGINLPGPDQAMLPAAGDFFLESEEAAQVPREISSVFFLAHFYLNALGTMAEFYVSLTPTQLRSLQEASARNFSEYLGQLESMVGFLLPNESYSRPYATLPPICGRVLTRYGLFWYHSEIPPPRHNHLYMDPLWARGGSQTHGDPFYIYYDRNQPSELHMLQSTCQALKNKQISIGSVSSGEDSLLWADQQEYMCFSPPCYEYDGNDERVYPRGLIMPIEEFERVKASPIHIEPLTKMSVNALPIPAYTSTKWNAEDVKRLLQRGGKGGPQSVNLLAEYAPSVHNHLIKMDIYMQAAILSGELATYKAVSNQGTYYRQSPEMKTIFQSIWDFSLRLQPSPTPLEHSISVRPTSEPLNLKTLLLNCLDFLFNAIDSKINAIILENVERFCESSRIGEANKQDFFRHFRLELDDNEEAGLQTMVGETGRPFEHRLLLSNMHFLINSPPCNSSRSTGRGALGTVRTTVFCRQSLMGVPNSCIAFMAAKLLQAGAKHLSAAHQLGSLSTNYAKMLARINSVEQCRSQTVKQSLKAMKHSLLKPADFSKVAVLIESRV